MAIEEQIISINATIRHAMALLNKAPIKLCIAVDIDGRVLRTVADGDIRRALLQGATLDAPISSMAGREPVVFEQDTPPGTLISALDEHDNINALVLIDAEHRPVGLANRTSLRSTILLSPPHLGIAEAEYVQQAFDDNWIAPARPNLEAFEHALCVVTDRRRALALSSGTAALHLALRVLDVGPERHVYVSDLTFAASLQPILYQNARPVLIDSDPRTWNMSAQALERRLSKDAASGTLPAAIIIVHLYGQSADMAAIMPLAERYGIPVIEDAAESIGASYRNRPSGSHGLLAAYSFNGNKIITTSGGGALVSDRQDLIERAKVLATQGREPAEHYQHSEVAYNYRMSNVLAGIGLGQLELLSDRVARRRAIFQRYHDGLSDIEGISFQEEADGSRGNRWLTVITLDPDRIGRHPYQLLRRLRQEGIESRPAWKPMHMQPLCAGFDIETHSESEIVSSRLFLQSLCLPSGSSLGETDQARVVRIIRRFAEGQD
jgi:dTDP-4-amino-4,6-dideoxygalactose transaminase